MKLFILVGILALTVTLSLAIVVVLYRHKKSGSAPIKVVGNTGEVVSDLAPEGTVLVHGELWRARSGDGSTISGKTPVRIIGAQDHLLLVKPSSESMTSP